jgi:hypothetical protein
VRIQDGHSDRVPHHTGDLCQHVTRSLDHPAIRHIVTAFMYSVFD